MTRVLIVNADDFGLAECVNRGIEKAHREGILTSATLLSNGPAFSDAVERIGRAADLGVGLHLNLLRGRPVAPPDRVAALVGADGRMHGGFLSAGLRSCSRAFRQAAEYEYNAQIEKALRAGVRLTHLDSEKHHAVWPPLARVVERLAIRHGIPALRRPAEAVWTCLRRMPGVRVRGLMSAAVVRSVAAMRRARLATPGRFFGQVHIGAMDEAVWLRLLDALAEGVTEVMTHPGFYLPQELSAAAAEMGASWIDARREAELRALCSERVRAAVQRNAIDLRTFAACATGSAHPSSAA